MNVFSGYFTVASFLLCCLHGTANGAPPSTCSGSFEADSDDCSKFYVCIHGQAIPMNCPSGLNFNQKINICDWPVNTECKKSNTPSTPSQPESPSTPTPISEPNQPPQPTPNQPSYNPSASPQANHQDHFDYPEYEDEEPNHKGQQQQQPLQPSHGQSYPSLVPAVPSQSNSKCGPNKKSVCYYTNWSVDRTGDGKFEPEDIDTKLCTNIIYAFAVIDPSTSKMKVFNPKIDTDGKKLYKKVTGLKTQGVNVSIAIGGWTDSLAQNYGAMLTDPQKRSTFVQSAEEFVKKYGFDGLDLDLEYPGCWQTNCDSSRAPAEKAGFADLVKELHDAFKPEGLLLSAAVSASPYIIDQAYDIPKLSEYLDFINLMSYDYHGSWEHKTGHIAPFGGSDNLNVKASVDYWLKKGAASEKLVIGMPTYGKSLTLHSQQNGFNAPADAGQTGVEGTVPYYEICQKVKNEGWKSVHDNQIGPYAYKGNQWVSYDDVQNVRNKGKYICEKGLGGGMIWTLDFDDFKGKHCRCGKYPLLTTLNQEIRGVGGPAIQNCT